jgi:diacylglycerol kinase family enzyme/Ca2+-binding EF-hand superfamily protein
MSDIPVPANPEPLALFINSRSGGQQGATLTTGLAACLLPGDKLFDLAADKGPAKGLQEFQQKGKPYRAVACGGDGTVGWVLSTFDKINLHPNPPLAILPLGTGNDISRTLNWGPGYVGEDLAPILNKARAAKPVAMDRWKAVFHGLPESNPHREPSVVNAYIGLGIDAEIALKFHNLREEMPGLFCSRMLNKMIYSHLGFTSMLSSHSPFSEIVKLEINGAPHPVPAGLTGICLLNLPSWGGGKNPWGPEDPSDSQFRPQVIDDSMLEVIGFTGAFHLAQIQIGLQYGVRIAQAKSVKITTTASLPLQIDGEAWVIEPCSIEVNLLNKTNVLVYTDKTGAYKPPVGTPLKDRTRVEVKELAAFNFTVDKLEAVHKQHGEKQLNKEEFIQVLNQITGLHFDQKNPELTDRLFHIFDTDKSGSVDFKELTVGLTTLGSGTLEKKLAFVFSLFDTKGTGSINRDQLTVAFRTLFSMLYTGEAEQLVKLYVTLLLELYDENKDGSITLDELHTAAKNDEVLAHLFTFGAHHK